MSDPITTTHENIVAILTQRFGQGDPGTGLSMDTHEAHMLMSHLHARAQPLAACPETDQGLTPLPHSYRCEYCGKTPSEASNAVSLPSAPTEAKK